MAVVGTWSRVCVLKDISATGAKLEVEGSTDVLTSREVFQVLSSTCLAFRGCQLVWLEGPAAGGHCIHDKRKSAS